MVDVRIGPSFPANTKTACKEYHVLVLPLPTSSELVQYTGEQPYVACERYRMLLLPSFIF
jgi:hypothetical protein